MVWYLALISVALAGTAIATISDIKTKEVPDWISYTLIVTGVLSHLAMAASQQTITPILHNLYGLSFAFIIGSSMFYTGLWGGGDAKLLMGLASLIPTYATLNTNAQIFPLLFTLWTNIVLAGAIIGGAVLLQITLKNLNKVKRELSSELKRKEMLILAAIIIVLTILGVTQIKVLPVHIWLVLPVVYSALLWAQIIERNFMFKFIKPSQLTEGDWVAKEIKIANRIVYKPEKTGITKKYIKNLKALDR